MSARILFGFLVSLLLLTPSLAQSVAKSSRVPATAAAFDNADDLSDMKADLARMRVLVTQMQNNLGLTTNSTTPLYHQFDLEIQMWQLLIGQMERRIDRMERSKEPPIENRPCCFSSAYGRRPHLPGRAQLGNAEEQPAKIR